MCRDIAYYISAHFLYNKVKFKIMTLRKLIENNKNILDANIFIDCLDGDKFMANNIEYDEKNNSLVFKIHRGDRIWIETGYKHPIKICK